MSVRIILGGVLLSASFLLGTSSSARSFDKSTHLQYTPLSTIDKGTPSNEAILAYNRALESYQARNYREALKQLELPLRESFADASYLAALCHEQLENSQEAEALYLKTEAIDGNYLDAYLNLGFLYYEQGKYDDAIFQYKRLLSKDANHPKALRNLGVCYYEAGELDKAALYLEMALEQSPDDKSAQDYYAKAVNGQDPTGGASSSKAKSVLNKAPSQAVERYEKGIAYYEQQSYVLAAREFEAAIAIDRNEAAFYDGLGKAEKGAGNPERSLKAYEKAVALKPSLYSAWVAIAQLKYDARQYMDAVDAYRQALEQGATDPFIAYNLGTVLVQTEYYADAEAYFKRFTQSVRNHADGFFNLGMSQFLQRKFRESVASFQQCLAIDPNNNKAAYELSAAYIELGNHKRAIENAEELIRREPNYALGYFIIAVSYDRQDNIEKKLEYEEKAYRLDASLRKEGF